MNAGSGAEVGGCMVLLDGVRIHRGGPVAFGGHRVGFDLKSRPIDRLIRSAGV